MASAGLGGTGNLLRLGGAVVPKTCVIGTRFPGGIPVLIVGWSAREWPFVPPAPDPSRKSPPFANFVERLQDRRMIEQV